MGILNRAKETRDEAQGQLKASLKTKKPKAFSKTSNPAAKLSAGPIRAGETQISMDLHQEQTLLPWREEAAIAIRKINWARGAVCFPGLVNTQNSTLG